MGLIKEFVTNGSQAEQVLRDSTPSRRRGQANMGIDENILKSTPRGLALDCATGQTRTRVIRSLQLL
jgi:hypothetical protein